MKCTLCLYCAQVRRLKLELFVFFLVFLSHSHIPCMLHRYNSKHRVCERLCVRACVGVCVYCMPTPRARAHTHKQRTHTALNPTKLTDTESPGKAHEHKRTGLTHTFRHPTQNTKNRWRKRSRRNTKVSKQPRPKPGRVRYGQLQVRYSST